ncbi:MAG: hypothetical protein AB8C84_00285 [Oligoflexales bacterium]
MRINEYFLRKKYHVILISISLGFLLSCISYVLIPIHFKTHIEILNHIGDEEIVEDESLYQELQNRMWNNPKYSRIFSSYFLDKISSEKKKESFISDISLVHNVLQPDAMNNKDRMSRYILSFFTKKNFSRIGSTFYLMKTDKNKSSLMMSLSDQNENRQIIEASFFALEKTVESFNEDRLNEVKSSNKKSIKESKIAYERIYSDYKNNMNNLVQEISDLRRNMAALSLSMNFKGRKIEEKSFDMIINDMHQKNISFFPMVFDRLNIFELSLQAKYLEANVEEKIKYQNMLTKYAFLYDDLGDRYKNQSNKIKVVRTHILETEKKYLEILNNKNYALALPNQSILYDDHMLSGSEFNKKQSLNMIFSIVVFFLPLFITLFCLALLSGFHLKNE